MFVKWKGGRQKAFWETITDNSRAAIEQFPLLVGCKFISPKSQPKDSLIRWLQGRELGKGTSWDIWDPAYVEIKGQQYLKQIVNSCKVFEVHLWVWGFFPSKSVFMNR